MAHGYIINSACDGTVCVGTEWGQRFGQFYGASKRAAFDDMKKHGWTFSGEHCWCPLCTKRKGKRK